MYIIMQLEELMNRHAEISAFVTFASLGTVALSKSGTVIKKLTP